MAKPLIFVGIIICCHQIVDGQLPVDLEITSECICDDGSYKVVPDQNFKLECTYGYPETEIVTLVFFRGSETIIDYPNNFQEDFLGRSLISYTDESSIVEITAKFDANNTDNSTYFCRARIEVDGNLQLNQSDILDIKHAASQGVTEGQLLGLLDGAEDATINSSSTVVISATLSEEFGCRLPSIHNVTESDQAVCIGGESGSVTACEIPIDVNTFDVDEVKTYTVYIELCGTATSKNFTITRNGEECDCCTYAFGLFLGPGVIVPICHIISMTTIILILTGVICAACSCVKKCNKADKLWQVKFQSVIHIVIVAFEIACIIAVGICFGHNQNQPEECNCEDESPAYMVAVPVVLVTIHITVVIVAILVIPKNIREDEPKPTSKIRHQDLPEGIAVKDPITPRKLPPIGKTYDH